MVNGQIVGTAHDSDNDAASTARALADFSHIRIDQDAELRFANAVTKAIANASFPALLMALQSFLSSLVSAGKLVNTARTRLGAIFLTELLRTGHSWCVKEMSVMCPSLTGQEGGLRQELSAQGVDCLLYTSDAADE